MKDEILRNAFVGVCFFLMGAFAVYISRPETPEPCWETIADVEVEYWYQNKRKDMEWKIHKGEATQEEIDKYNKERPTVFWCAAYKPFDNSDIVFYRKMTHKEMFQDWKDQQK